MLKRCYQLLALLALAFLSVSVQATPIARYARFTGNYNYVVTGGSLRTQPNSVNSCALGTTSTQTLGGVPAGSTVVAAYLYWGGSGSTVDSSVSLNGSTVIANRTFTTIPAVTGTTFFGGAADVTGQIVGNGSITFGNLSVDSSNTYCGNSSVMAAWSLLVVYSNNSEPLRAINIFDGLDWFYNSSLSLTPDGFRIPASGIDGQMTAITWEGDPDLGGASETLNFNSSVLDPQGYDSLSHFAASGAGTNTNGVDVDTYNISSLLSAGQTTGSTYYSAGGDLVFLTAQIISVTSSPQVDLSITKSHSGNFTVGSNASYTLHVANASGVQQVDYLTTVTDTLPAGLTYISAVGTGWSCGAVGQTVTCTHAAPLASGSAFPDITLTVAVTNAAYPSVTNTVSVSTAGSNDYINSNNSATDTATVNGSNLSTSTKTVSDINGGEANVGDTLRYTITLTNSSMVNATGVSVSDSLPGNTSNLTVVSYPAGATNTSSSAALSISNVTVPPSGNVTIVFDVTVATGTSPGAKIDNTATITNPAGTGATPSATQVEVSPSLVAGNGTKQLYLYGQTGGTPAYPASRTAPATAQTAVTIAKNTSVMWRLNSPLRSAVTLQAGSHAVQLLLSRSSNGTSRTVNVILGWATSLASAPTPIANGTVTFSNTTDLGTAASLRTISLVAINSGTFTVPAGGYFTLEVSNTTGGSNNRDVIMSFAAGTTDSRVELNSASVINVNSVQTYNAAYSGGVVTSSFNRGSTAYIRAVVSDPFGSFDISSATLVLTNPSAAVVINGSAMTQVNDSTLALKTYEYAYAIPTNAPAGIWTASVTANEGVEGVKDLGVGTFAVTIPMPTLQVSKVSTVLWDPVNLNTNPKRIPGSIVSYTITVSNSGPGSVDASTLVMTDAVPANTSLCVSNVGQCTAIQFADGSPVSGLSYSSGNTTYSNTVGGGTPFSYTPTADANGTDVAVTGIRIAPTGALTSASGSGNPGFSISFRVKVN